MIDPTAPHWGELANHFVTFWVVSTIIHNMPAPLEGDRWYKWLYNSLQGLMANWGTLRAGKMPTPQEPPKS